MFLSFIFATTFIFVFCALILALLGSVDVVKFTNPKYLDRLFYGGICGLVAGVVGFLPYVYASQKFSAKHYSNFIRDVKNIQTALLFYGDYQADLDGILGAKTYFALEKFQKRNNIIPNEGQIDKKTINMLFSKAAVGMSVTRNERTEIVQNFSWRTFSYRVKEFQETFDRDPCSGRTPKDGIIRKIEMTDAIMCFQEDNKITSDGELGVDTILNIVESDLKSFNSK